jgi:uncharacterized membrane protein (UPF0127 family)
MTRQFIVFLLLVLVVSSSIANSSNLSIRDFYITLPNGIKIKAEAAKDKRKGLQERKSLCSTCGMVFIFDNEGYYPFWMKDTLINLAIIWIDINGRIVYIVRNAEPCIGKQNPYTECEIYSPLSSAKYVLEVNPKAAKGVEVGMKIKSASPL